MTLYMIDVAVMPLREGSITLEGLGVVQWRIGSGPDGGVWSARPG